MIQAILHGFLLALGLILPLGAQNVFVFNQGANHKSLKKSLPVVITAGLCDTLLILLAVLGVSLILNHYPSLQLIVYIVGLFFLLYMAWSLWNEKPANTTDQPSMSAKKQIGFAMSVSLLNPHAIMDTIGVIGTSASIYSNHEKIAFTITTILVSWLWFICLALIGKIVGRIDTSGKFILILNKISSIIILVVATIILGNIWSSRNFIIRLFEGITHNFYNVLVSKIQLMGIHDDFIINIIIIILSIIISIISITIFIMFIGYILDFLLKDFNKKRIIKKFSKKDIPSANHQSINEYNYFRYFIWERQKKKIYIDLLDKDIQAREINTKVYSRKATSKKVRDGIVLNSIIPFYREVYYDLK